MNTNRMTYDIVAMYQIYNQNGTVYTSLCSIDVLIVTCGSEKMFFIGNGDEQSQSIENVNPDNFSYNPIPYKRG